MNTLIHRIKAVLKKIPVEVYIFLFAVLYRLPTLGYDFVNNDAFHWKERGYAFGAALVSLNLKDTAVTYHPGVPLLYSQFIANKIFTLLDSLYFKGGLSESDLFLVNHAIQKFVIVIITSVLDALVYYFAKQIMGKKVALLAVMLVLFEPFYIALSRAVHTDVFLTLFMTLSILIVFIIFSKQGLQDKKVDKKKAIVAGFFIGCAWLTKSSGLFLIGFFGIYALYLFVHTEKNKRKKLFTAWGLILGVAILTFMILWPSMLVAPIDTLKLYLFEGVQGVALEEGHGHMWFGTETQDPGVLFYPLMLIGRYTPLLILLSIGGVLYLAIKHKTMEVTERSFIIYLLAYIGLFFLMITLVSKKLDRYSLPLVYALAIVAVYYLPSVLRRNLLFFGIGVFLVYRIFLTYGLHPNYLAYYSPVIGGAKDGKNIIEPKWLVGYDEVARYFDEFEDKDEIVVAIADYDYLRPFADFKVVNIRHETERENADYFVLPVYREERNQYYYDRYELEELRNKVEVMGMEYYKVFKFVEKKE